MGSHIGRCRDCGAEVLWAVTKAGKRVALEPDTDPDGNGRVAPVYDEEAEVYLAKYPWRGDPPRKNWALHMVHFDVCPRRESPDTSGPGTGPGRTPTPPSPQLPPAPALRPIAPPAPNPLQGKARFLTEREQMIWAAAFARAAGSGMPYGWNEEEALGVATASALSAMYVVRLARLASFAAAGEWGQNDEVTISARQMATAVSPEDIDGAETQEPPAPEPPPPPFGGLPAEDDEGEGLW